MSVTDFELMDFDDFMFVSKAYHDNEEAQLQGMWNRMRLLATYVVMPYSKGVTPQQLLPLPWDKKGERESRHTHREEKHLTHEERRRRMQDVLHRLEKNDKQ